MLTDLALGFSVAFTAGNLGLCLLGCLIGTLIGVLPGIGPLATMAMLLPLNDDAQGRHRSALVWTVAEKDAAGVIKLPDAIFLSALEEE